jgi:hypothetical protein
LHGAVFRRRSPLHIGTKWRATMANLATMLPRWLEQVIWITLDR